MEDDEAVDEIICEQNHLSKYMIERARNDLVATMRRVYSLLLLFFGKQEKTNFIWDGHLLDALKTQCETQ